MCGWVGAGFLSPVPPLPGCINLRLRRVGGAAPQAPRQGVVGDSRVAAAGSLWLVAQFPAPLKSKSLRLPGRPGEARTPNHLHLPSGGRGRGPVRRMPVA
ncbi:hypothetical protein GCM10010094_49710 [Streptomyces flaveus]|uniref:Uncharacterized protein n=1 Tax=Streptomyces flaveus TaxID=66370 RepID=A0A917R124_9ACTN|nr:hypothetical protein GCM10010094_49710 [Streptomyces flaveus]